ncbi:FUSC family protein [Actinomadura sp. NPDC047616]|uniref:FUSC family protein n=1 Tax=Actinomadura sp. NPDC047616 TaxID=3155914 RepID=UPI0033F6AD7A
MTGRVDEVVRRAAATPGRWHYWRGRLHIVVKAVLASVLAWLAARYLMGHRQPYFAPLAALLGVYPTVARSLRESLAYAAGFLVGALLAIPVGMTVGPNPAGIAVVVAVALLVSSWHGFGDQAPQVPFTALFALLVGGHEVMSYVVPRLGDVGVGLAVGLAVNTLVFPPLHIGRADAAVRDLKEQLACALEELASLTRPPGAGDAEDGWTRWGERERRLRHSHHGAYRACEQGRDSLRANPRVKLRRRRADGHGAWRSLRLMDTLDHTATYVRSIADALREASRTDPDGALLDARFRDGYARQLDMLAGLVRSLPDGSGDDAAEARGLQQWLEQPYRGAGTDAPGLWDPRKELLRLSGLLLDNVCTPPT